MEEMQATHLKWLQNIGQNIKNNEAWLNYLRADHKRAHAELNLCERNPRDEHQKRLQNLETIALQDNETQQRVVVDGLAAKRNDLEKIFKSFVEAWSEAELSWAGMNRPEIKAAQLFGQIKALLARTHSLDRMIQERAEMAVPKTNLSAAAAVENAADATGIGGTTGAAVEQQPKVQPRQSGGKAKSSEMSKSKRMAALLS